MTIKYSWNLSSQVARLRAWLRPEATSFNREEPRLELAKRIKEFEPKTLDYAANALSYISMWESQVGALSVLEGDMDGWGHLQLGLAYSVWRVRTSFHIYKKAVAESRTKEISRMHGLVARCLAMAIALRDDESAHWCGSLLLQEISHPTGFLSNWGYTGFYPFMAWLYARWQNIEVDINQEPFQNLGIYQSVVDHWNHDNALATAIAEVSDYHCVHTTPSDGDDPEFWQSPFQVFAAEILAILRVRHDETRVTFFTDHPLLSSALGKVPDDISVPADPLLEEFKTRLIADEMD